jgi:hypothetical protein
MRKEKPPQSNKRGQVMKISLSTDRNAEGAYIVTAYVDDEYAGNSAFYLYNKREALRKAREMIKEQGGLGLYAKVIRTA